MERQITHINVQTLQVTKKKKYLCNTTTAGGAEHLIIRFCAADISRNSHHCQP
jgi:hypothetical protein